MAERPGASGLSASTLALLRRRLAGEGYGAGTPPLAEDDGSGRLSFGQQRLWFLDRFSPGLAAYNVPAAVRIDGPVNGGILERAFTEVIARHAVLRAVFREDEGRPVQQIQPAGRSRLDLIDLARLPVTAREAAAMDRIADLAAAPFDLARGPLLRASLLRLSDVDHVLVIVLHHIVADGASAELLIGEVATLCLDFAQGLGPSLPPLPSQYAAHVGWQHAEFERGAWAPQLDYWREKLRGAVPLLELPIDLPRRPLRHRGAKLVCPLDPELARPLRELAVAHQTTLFTLLLCAFQTLMARYTGSTDVLIGTPVNTRTRPEFEPLIGFFVNTLVLRTDLGGDPSFEQALRRSRRTVIEALEHQDVPFELLVRELNPERSVTHTPLVQVMFSFQPGSPGRTGSAGLTFRPVSVHAPVAKFDLTLYVTEDDGRLVALFEYDTALFLEPTIAQIARHYAILLQSIVDTPRRPLSALSLRAPGERWWLETAGAPADSGSIHRAFERQAAKSPDAVAIRWGGESVAYRELDAQASALAWCLARAGARQGQLIAVLLDRSPSLVAALLGVLKTGAAYLPIDPQQPVARIAAILEDAQPAVILAERATLPRWPGCGPPPIVIEDVEASATRPFESVDAVDLAYVIFTSGSTGRPKGVAVTHAAVLNVLGSIGDDIGAGAADRLLAVTTVSFDIAALELFLPLVRGATVVLASADDTRDAARLRHVMTADRVTILQATPATWRLLLADGWEGQPDLRALIGGEALAGDLARAVAQRAGRAWNVYGPTEATIWATIWPIPRDLERVSLGRGVAGTQVRLLDRRGVAVPPGAVGEVHIGGVGLARGYWRQAALTAERFVPDALADTPGARLYRTGDLARLRRDGTLEFLGRTDDQLKIRGYRVEPGEIETALTAMPGVLQAAAVSRPGPAGEPQMAAFVVRSDRDAPVEELREGLRERLPEYMIPSRIVDVAALPLTHAGKIDRHALARRDVRPERSGSIVPPRTLDEERLAAIWAQTLERPDVGMTDDFFASGGHSLLAARLLVRVRSALEVDVPLREFFEQPTIAGLASAVTRHRAAKDRQTTRILPRAAGAPPPDTLSLAQERLFFLQRLEPASGAYNVCLAARFHRPLEPSVLASALDDLSERHEVFRTGFTHDGGAPRATVWPSTRIPLEVTDLADLDPAAREQRIDEIARQTATQAFEIARPPLARAHVVTTGLDDCVLVLVVHHLIADGGSLPLLVSELGASYRARAAGHAPGHRAPSIQYADFAAWQRAILSPDALGSRITAWAARLADAAAPIDLPTDRVRPALAGDAGAHFDFDLDASLIERLRELARSHDATLFMTLLAAWQACLFRWTGSTRFLIGTPVADRPFAELEAVIGMFTGTMALRADLGGDPSVDALVERVRRHCLDAFAERDLPFEMLVDALAPPRDLSRTPLFQVMFAMNNAAAAAGWEPLRIDAGKSTFDLTLTVTDAGRQLTGNIEYRVDLFEPATIVRLAESFRTLLAAAVAEPATSVSRLPLGAPDPPPARADDAERASILEQIEAAASLAPGATAIVSELETLTYADLMRSAAATAAALWSDGLRPEDRVAIDAVKTPQTIEAILGLLAAGVTYVPLDPRDPPARRDQLLLASGAKRTWRPGAALRRSPGERGPRPPAPHRSCTAYLMFTSGSTGRPKGVLVPHSALAHYGAAARHRFALAPSDRVLQFAPLTFDTSIEEIFPTLAAGATLVLPPPDLLDSIERFLDFCARQSVTVLDLPTAFWHELVSIMEGESRCLPDSVRLVILGGEAVRSDRVAVWRRIAPDVELLNTYGPTETTVVATAADVRVAACWSDPGCRVPIGEPMPGVLVYLLDDHLRPVPAGVRGELCVGGAGVARGYLGDPALTALRFVPDPFAGRPGARLYRTGDRARVNNRGEVEFLGRRDVQLKVRGHRVEPAEIEAALTTHPGITHTAVVATDGGTDAVRLVACVVPVRGRELTASGLRAYLSERLPEYLVPEAFVVAATIPTTRAGKVDSAAIAAAPWADPAVPERSGGADPLDDLVLQVWSDVLGRTVGPHDDFFALGGNSLMALRLAWALREACGRDVPLRRLFEAPTPAGVAEYLRGDDSRERHLPPIERSDSAGRAPLSLAQEKVWSVVEHLPGTPMFNISATVALEADIEPRILADALETVAARHAVLGARVAVRDGAPVMVTGRDEPLEVEFFDLSSLPDVEREPAARELMEYLRACPFDLTTGPLVRLCLVRLDPPRHLAMVSLHHIIGDGLSVDVLMNELEVVYRAGVTGVPVSLPTLDREYADFAGWQRRALADGRFDGQLAFWREVLRPPWEPFSVGGARPPRERASYDVDRRFVRVPRDLFAPLADLARRERTTPFMGMLAAIDVLISSVSGARDIRIATMAANRRMAGTESLIGLFANTIILRTSLAGSPTFIDVLHRVRHTVLSAFDRQEVPFEAVLQDLERDGPLDGATLAPMLFLWQYAAPAPEDAGNWRTGPRRVVPGDRARAAIATKYSIIWEFSESAEGLNGTLTYSTDLYAPAEIDELVDRLVRLLPALAARPDEPVSGLVRNGVVA